MGTDNNHLTRGQDSGAPDAKTKLHVAFNCGGKCSFPECGKHLTKNGTNIGKCAHIIPKKVGFVREDWKTPLEDRKRPENLIYLCGDCHDVVDDRANEAQYPADVLRRWKKDHEQWALSRRNQLTHIPQSIEDKIKETLSNCDEQFKNETQISTHLMEGILSCCKDLLQKNYIDQAALLLDQSEILLGEYSTDILTSEYESIRAKLLWKQEKIPDAKTKYRDIIDAYAKPDDIFDYIELCDSAPASSDQISTYKDRIENTHQNHPRLELSKLFAQYKRQENLSGDIQENFEKNNDVWLNARFCNAYALLYDLERSFDKRDQFISKWETILPDSPRPIFFQIIFLNMDLRRTGVRSKDQVQDHLEKIAQLENRMASEDKYPLALSDRMSLILEKINLYCIISKFSVDEPNEFPTLRDDLFELIKQSYFDNHVNHITTVLLSSLLIDSHQWHALVDTITASDVSPSNELTNLIYTQAIRLKVQGSQISMVLDSLQRQDLIEIHHALLDSNWIALARHLDKNEIDFVFFVIQSINDPKATLKILQHVEFPNELTAEKKYLEIDALVRENRHSEAVKIAEELELSELNIQFLNLINHAANLSNHSKLIIQTGELILTHDTPKDYSAGLCGKIAIAYATLGDDSRAYHFAKKSLENIDALGIKNTISLIVLSTTALINMNRTADAVQLAQRYTQYVQEEPGLGLFFADIYLKTNVAGDTLKALECVIETFRNSKADTDRLFLNAFMILNELGHRKVIELKNESTVDDSLFLKIDGIPNTWFFIGEESYAFDATAIGKTDGRYFALKGKSIGEEIDWPADKFSSTKSAKKITHIVSPAAYLNERAHEAMQSMVSQGNEGVWSVEILTEQGSINKDNLLNFFEETFGGQKDVFNQYCETGLPFSLLCRSERSIENAIGRICSEHKGFIKCNNGTMQNIQTQYKTADAILDGSSFFIDSLAALMLGEADLLGRIIDRLPGNPRLNKCCEIDKRGSE